MVTGWFHTKSGLFDVFKHETAESDILWEKLPLRGSLKLVRSLSQGSLRSQLTCDSKVLPTLQKGQLSLT